DVSAGSGTKVGAAAGVLLAGAAGGTGGAEGWPAGADVAAGAPGFGGAGGWAAGADVAAGAAGLGAAGGLGGAGLSGLIPPSHEGPEYISVERPFAFHLSSKSAAALFAFSPFPPPPFPG